MADHVMEVTYTYRDDGIHVVCTCGFDRLLGDDPSPADVWNAAQVHMAEAALNAASPAVTDYWTGWVGEDGTDTHSVPATSSTARMHEMNRSCWCSPACVGSIVTHHPLPAPTEG